KSATPEEITAAIRATAEGRSILAPPVAAALVRKVRTGVTARVLSHRETDVLRLVGMELSNAEIAERLYLEPSTVKTHIEHIYAKLGIGRRPQAVAKAKELGLT
ncbi:MAG: response regulator transcription factor, partial [Actinomycetia bacterium]|nr:response regulator transcription factor [Actinomycetes bacterium]